MEKPANDPWMLRGGMGPGVAAGLVTGLIALALTGDLIRGLAFFLGVGIAFSLAPRIKDAFRELIK
jgi:predicted lipid-binding transport protein (Tim44 family)